MEQLINFIIRPPRAEYNPKNDLLGQEFMLKGKWYQRKDLEVVNSRGDSLQCSHHTPLISPEGNALPCVIYCHGNSGCRTDASEVAVILLPSNITVFSLDFSGSGVSGGEHVTLGWNEKDDLRAVVDYLRADGNVSLIGLWGRSMGAVTSLMYGADDPSIAGMVLDSPFSDLVDLMMELVDTYKIRLPKFTVKFAIQYMRKAIQKKAKFDIMELNTIKVAKSCFVPVLFGHAIDDDFIQPHHSDRIFDVYVGDKNIIKFEGDHNSPRPQFYFDSISIFFNNVLQPPEDGAGSTYFDLSNNFFSKGRWSTVHDVEISTEVLGSISGSAGSSSSIEDAIKQLRSKQPMSAMVLHCTERAFTNKFYSRVKKKRRLTHLLFSGLISKLYYFRLIFVYRLSFLFYVRTCVSDYCVIFKVPADISSKDNQPYSEVESRGSDSRPSTSNTTSFEFCGGSPRSSNVHGSVDDDEYIEYPLDMLADFPSNVEEEERMLMVAILESLKHSEASHPPFEEVSPGVGVSALHKPKPAPKKEEDRVFPCSNSLETESVSNQLLPYSSHTHAPSSDAEAPHTNNMAEGDTSGPASRSNTPSDDQRLLSDADMADRTKVIVEVEKNPSSNVIDGLLRRWDFNFFRNR